jgi:signal transduction histidine kinase
MVRPPNRLLAVLAATTLVVTAALCWAGWRLLDQQRTIDKQREREQLENRADAIAADIRGRLAEAGERLAGWLSDPATPFQPLENAVLVGIDASTVLMVPRNALPYVPVTPRSPDTPDVFSKIEAIEFGALNTEEAADRYRGLMRAPNAHVRAGALLRLGRVLRKSKDFRGALVAYRELASSGDVWIEGLPAELAALQGRRATLTAMGDRENAARVTSELVEQLDRGRWPITRGLAEFHRDEVGGAPRPDSWRLAYALHETIAEANGRLPGRGQRVLKTDRRSVLVLWRSSGDRTALLSAFADRFFSAPVPEGLAWRLADAGGEIIVGDSAAPLQSAARILGNAEYPWTVHTWNTASHALGDTRSNRTILFAMMAAMLVFVWGASYFIARAIRREAEVARLQSDFIAAVSHEFRSPLTTVRQMAEMLETDRLPSEDRRRKYYRVIASEAARLQRLVETLLNFGRMEAGAAHYHFAGVDAATLVRNVVHEIEPQARETGRLIEMSGPDAEIRLRGDAGALALALRNLIDNALKYSPNDSTVQVQWKRENDRAAICVVDRGVGIPQTEQQAIFRKFVRGRSAIDANIKGTGVGLSMVQEIVLAHGGEIRLESEITRGSAFTLMIPLHDAGASS